MRLKTHQRMTRKAAVAAALLGATLVLPGTAVANHDPNNIRNPYTCDPSVPDDCPHFEANFAVRVQNPVKNQSSAVQFQFSQPDRRMPVMRADYYLPTGWRFGGLSNLRSSAHSGIASHQAACNAAHNTDGTLNQTELLSADTGMLLQVDGNRFDDPSNQAELENAVLDPTLGPVEGNDPPFEYGVRNPGGTTEGNRWPSVSFIDWDGTTARLCYHHRNNNSSAPAVTFIQTATLTRLAGDPNFDWRFSIDPHAIMGNANVIAERGSVLEHHVALGALTAGNWNRHPVTGELQKVSFGRTPLTPGAYTFRADLFTCAEGLSAAHATGCANGTFVGQTLSQVVNITPAPDTIKYEFGRLTGPSTAGLCDGTLCSAGLIRGSNQFGVTWSQPPLVDGQEVRGYVLTLALPGNQQSRKFYRFVTDPDTPGFNASVCGPAGGDPNCTFTISLPVQSSDGSTTLTPDRKYHLALVTIYSDGRRTDLLCDDAIGAGVSCPASMPRLNRQEPGISEWQVLHRSDDWPLVFVEAWGDTAALAGNPHDPFINRMLLVDFTLKEAEFITWNTNDAVTSYRAVSNGIIGDNSIPVGVVEMGNGTNGGATQNWLAGMVVDPLLAMASGTFVRYDAKNPDLDPINVSGYPELGHKGCESVAPILITPFPSTCFTFFGFPL